MIRPLKTIWNLIKSWFPRFNRAMRRKFLHQQRRQGAYAQSLLERYHLLWQKRLGSSGWWYRARRVKGAAA